MKKLILSLAVLVTTLNMAAGAAYAAACMGTSGGRHCGEICTTLPGGDCACRGSCTSAEPQWVGGGGKVAMMEELAY